MSFGGGHHPKPFDWRDDHELNPAFQRDPRMIGVRLPETYSFPHEAEADVWHFAHPPEYNPKDLATNLVNSHKRGLPYNAIEAPHTDYLADIAHELDYESEDLDFQAETFKSQHFRKKGPLWMWVIASGIPFWFVISELIWQGWPEEDNWRYQRPPPLSFPSEEETPDMETWKLFKSKGYQKLYDAGIVWEPFFDIIDGKKVYIKEAGVNQPYEVI